MHNNDDDNDSNNSNCNDNNNTNTNNINDNIGNGPKFICENAFEILNRIAKNLYIPSLSLIKILFPFASHKNAEIGITPLTYLQY